MVDRSRCKCEGECLRVVITNDRDVVIRPFALSCLFSVPPGVPIRLRPWETPVHARGRRDRPRAGWGLRKSRLPAGPRS